MASRSHANKGRVSRETEQPEPLRTTRLDRLIHGRVRLGIISALAANKSLTFSELRDLLKTSDGNLSVHARKLEEAGYVECEKTFQERVPRTVYRLTEAGIRAFQKYLSHLEAVIQTARGENFPNEE